MSKTWARRSRWILAAVVVAGVILLATRSPQKAHENAPPREPQTPFGRSVPDPLIPPRFQFGSKALDASPANLGWVQAADMDNDGHLDIAAGGGKHIYVFKSDASGKTWTRSGNLDRSAAIGANGGIAYDVDEDGDLDIISAKFYEDIGWWENPLERRGSLQDDPWVFHRILAVDKAFMHDVVLADLDGDGKAGEIVANLESGGYWNSRIHVIWLRPTQDPTAPWESHVVDAGRDGTGRPEGASHSHAGLDTGDIDGDGNLDIAFSNGWYEAPDDPSEEWKWHEITSLYGVSNILARDMDGDRDLDLVLSAGHHGFGVYWFENEKPAGDKWLGHPIDTSVEHPEGLAVLDLDADGDMEVLAVELFFESWTEKVHNLYLYDFDPSKDVWFRQNILPKGRNNHLFQMADMNSDSRVDIISQTAGDTWVDYHENITTEGEHR